MSITEVAAVVFAAAAVGAAAFEIALSAGAPLGEYALAGKYPGVLPPAMRVATALQAVLLLAMAGVMLSRAGLALPQWAGIAGPLSYAVLAFSVVSTVLNTITPSRKERAIWMPVTFVMLLSSAVVIFTAP